MTDREEFEKWYKTTNKGELSRFEIWQARGELDAVRIKELEAKLDKAKEALEMFCSHEHTMASGRAIASGALGELDK